MSIYFAVPNTLVTEKMIHDSMRSLGIEHDGSLEGAAEFDKNSMHLLDTDVSPSVKYHVLKYKHIFIDSAQYLRSQSLIPMDQGEFRTFKENAKWHHNKPNDGGR